MGNFFSKEESKSNVVENSSEASNGSKPGSVITSEDTKNQGKNSATGKAVSSSSQSGILSSKSKTGVVKEEKSQVSVSNQATKSATSTKERSLVSSRIGSVASKSNSGSSQSSVSRKQMENPVTKPEKRNISYINSKIPKLNAQMYVPKTGEFFEFNSYELGGNFTVLVFYSGNFCPVVLPELHQLKSVSRKTYIDYNLLAISTDTKESHKAFSHLGPAEGGLQNLNFVLVSDQTGDWSKAFQVYDESCHRAFPSYIILSPDLKIQFKASYDHDVGGNPHLIIDILNHLMEENSGDVKDASDTLSRSDSSHIRVSSDPDTSEKSISPPSSASPSDPSRQDSEADISISKKSTSYQSEQAAEQGTTISKTSVASNQSFENQKLNNNLKKEPSAF